MSKGEQFTLTSEQFIIPVRVFYPDRALKEGALYDAERGVLIGFEEGKVYHPAGGFNACATICQEQHPLVIGAEVYGFKARHCYDDTYTLYLA